MEPLFLGLDEDSFETMVRSVADGKTDKAGAAEFFRKHAQGTAEEN